jgi:ribosomal protein S18 acetylase RimI-like enzyme
MLGFTRETAELVGYGTWKIRTDLQLQGENELRRVIDVPFFGLDTKFQGEVDHDGHKLAGRLFATLETVARANELVTEEMPMHLVVEEQNERAVQFWLGRGFQEVERRDYGSVQYIRMLRT